MRLGLPKGRLLPTSECVLADLGFERKSTSIYRLAHSELTVWLLKLCDIPGLVEEGCLDIGIAPDEWIEETGSLCERLATFDGYTTRVSVLAPPDHIPRLDQLERLRVATSFPNIARRYLRGQASKLDIVEIHGSAEAYPPELADVVVDCVETGDTAHQHGLIEVERLLDSRLRLISHPNTKNRVGVGQIADRLISILNGQPHDYHQVNGSHNHAPRWRAVPFHHLPPYLRAALLPWIHHEGTHALNDFGEVRIACLGSGAPAYMRVWDRDFEVVYPGDRNLDELRAALEHHITTGGLRRDAPDLFGLVALLSVWDDAIREIGLYSGRIYMASEEAARRLFVIAGIDPPTPDNFHELLLEAQALELMYRFPVAYKFRREYGVENQCRLNGWGRRLAKRAFGDPDSAALRQNWSERLSSHLLEHRDIYTEHIGHVGSEGLTTAPADSWTLANRLPIPILL
jgi:ATP phosphoribosyltransferase